MNTMFRFVLFFLFLLSASQTWGISVTQHQYDVGNIVFGADAYVYDTSVNLRVCDNQCIKPQPQDVIKGYFLALVGDFLVTKSVKPAISAQKQAGHIPGTPQNANRLKQGKSTSSFFGENSGNRLTQQAFEKGKPVPGRPNVREHDFGISTGTGPNSGMQSRVRVHQDSKGRIHGHPSGPERF